MTSRLLQVRWCFMRGVARHSRQAREGSYIPEAERMIRQSRSRCWPCVLTTAAVLCTSHPVTASRQHQYEEIGSVFLVDSIAVSGAMVRGVQAAYWPRSQSLAVHVDFSTKVLTVIPMPEPVLGARLHAEGVDFFTDEHLVEWLGNSVRVDNATWPSGAYSIASKDNARASLIREGSTVLVQFGENRSARVTVSTQTLGPNEPLTTQAQLVDGSLWFAERAPPFRIYRVSPLSSHRFDDAASSLAVLPSAPVSMRAMRCAAIFPALGGIVQLLGSLVSAHRYYVTRDSAGMVRHVTRSRSPITVIAADGHYALGLRRSTTRELVLLAIHETPASPYQKEVP